MSTKQGPEQYLDNRSMCWSGHVYTIGAGPQLHLDVSAQQEPLPLLDISSLKESELHLDVSAQQEPLPLLDVSTLKGSELHLDVSAQQEPLPLLDVSTLKGSELHLVVNYMSLHLCCSWTCLHYRGEACAAPGRDRKNRGLSCIWTYLDNRSLC